MQHDATYLVSEDKKEKLESVPVSQIDVFWFNPRTEENESYEQIKESIKFYGLDHPVKVSRRPGEQRYTVSRGGNTRLKIYKQLYKETKDDRFKTISCIVETWPGEKSMLASHINENESRGRLHFGEYAIGVNRLLKMIRKPGDSSRTSQEKLRNHGVIVSFQRIPAIEYLAQDIAERMPHSAPLMNRRTVEKLCAVERGMIIICQKLDLVEGIGKTIIAHAMEEVDSPSGLFEVDDLHGSIRKSLQYRYIPSGKRDVFCLQMSYLFDNPARYVKQVPEGMLSGEPATPLREKKEEIKSKSQQQSLTVIPKKIKEIAAPSDADEKSVNEPYLAVSYQDKNISERIVAHTRRIFPDLAELIYSSDRGLGFGIDVPAHAFKSPLKVAYWYMIFNLSSVMGGAEGTSTIPSIDTLNLNRLSALIKKHDWNGSDMNHFSRLLNLAVGECSPIDAASIASNIFSSPEFNKEEMDELCSILETLKNYRREIISGKRKW